MRMEYVTFTSDSQVRDASLITSLPIPINDYLLTSDSSLRWPESQLEQTSPMLLESLHACSKIEGSVRL